MYVQVIELFAKGWSPVEMPLSHVLCLVSNTKADIVFFFFNWIQ